MQEWKFDEKVLPVVWRYAGIYPGDCCKYCVSSVILRAPTRAGRRLYISLYLLQERQEQESSYVLKKQTFLCQAMSKILKEFLSSSQGLHPLFKASSEQIKILLFKFISFVTYNKDDEKYSEKNTKILIDDNNFLLWIIYFYSHS